MVKFPYGVRRIYVVFDLFQSFQIIKKCDFMLIIEQAIDYDDIQHPSLLRTFGFSAISTYDLYLTSIFGTNTLI